MPSSGPRPMKARPAHSASATIGHPARHLANADAASTSWRAAAAAAAILGGSNPLTPPPLLWPSPRRLRDGANPSKAKRFHDLRTLQRPRNRAALATPVGRQGD